MGCGVFRLSLDRVMIQATSNINGLRLCVPSEYAGILPLSPNDELFLFEPLCFRGIKATVEPDAVVYDVGASFGIMTVQLALLTGDRGTVISFEPNAAAATLAAQLVEVNGLQERVRQVNVLVGEKSARVPFFVVSGYESVASTRNKEIVQFHPNALRREVAMIAMDDFVGPSPSVIKLDIEGSEYQFLLGAQRLLTKHQPDLVIETHALEIDGIGGNTLELCRMLEAFGYSLWNLETNQPTDASTYASVHSTRIGYLLASCRLNELANRLTNYSH